jgi:hypothetical protein
LSKSPEGKTRTSSIKSGRNGNGGRGAKNSKVKSGGAGISGNGKIRQLNSGDTDIYMGRKLRVSDLEGEKRRNG